MSFRFEAASARPAVPESHEHAERKLTAAELQLIDSLVLKLVPEINACDSLWNLDARYDAGELKKTVAQVGITDESMVWEFIRQANVYIVARQAYLKSASASSSLKN